MRTVLRAGAVVLTAAGVAALLATPAAAHLIVFKDGFVLEGTVKREINVYFDPVTKEPVHMPKGHFVLDDGPRRIWFSPTQAAVVEGKAPPPEEQVQGKEVFWVNGKILPPLLEVLETTELNDKNERQIIFRTTSDPPMKLKQQLGWLTPTYARFDAPGRYQWSALYLTRELGPDVVTKLLANHPAFKDLDKLHEGARAARRFRLVDFLVQAGWYEHAEKELDKIQGDFSMQKDRVAAARKSIGRYRARDRFEEIKRLHAAGLFELAKHKMTDFPDKDASEQMLATLQEIRSQYESGEETAREAARLLRDLRKEANGDAAPLGAAVDTILEELQAESAGRLEAFCGQARQAERQRKKGAKPDMSATELLSLATSGWLLGSAGAEPRLETALRLWKTRETILGYLRASSKADREALLTGLLAESRQDAILDEVQQMLPVLPPPEALQKPGPEAIERPIKVGRFKSSYQLLLPPEYRTSRLWPVLVLLHREGEKPEDMLRRFAATAAENGYVLVAPEWQEGTGNAFAHSPREHGVVLNTLRDLRRCVQIDSDRVFLFGLSEGANMAFEVGLAHPSEFAGVLPMGGGPVRFARAYWRNGQYLPFYVVTGNRGGETTEQVRKQFDDWILRGFPAIWADYKGRGVEWFSGELHNMFDWMRGKTRAFPLHQLGDGNNTQFGREMCTMRETENRFYWLQADEIHYSHTNSHDSWSGKVEPANMHARIDASNNEIVLQTSGILKATVLLGRNAKGTPMIDFDRPVTLRLGLSGVRQTRVKPNVRVLLEELHDRCDRQQLFLAKLEATIPH